MQSVSSSDEEEGLLGGQSSTGGRVGKAVFWALMVSGAALGGFFAGRSTGPAPQPSAAQVTQAPQQVPQQAEEPLEPRLLESDELADSAAHHTLAFYGELGLPLHELSPEMTAKLHQELANEAKLKVQHIVNNMEVEEPDAARELRELRVTPEQWKHAHKILEAMHDSRVQQIGKSVSQAISHAKNEEEARAATQRKLNDHKDELAGLAQELLPEGVRKASEASPQDASPAWAMTVNHKSHAVHTEGPIGNWHAAFEVAPPKFGRALQAAPQPAAATGYTQTGLPDWLVTTMAGLYVTVGTLSALIVGLLSMLLSAISGRAGALGTWWTFVGLNIAECGTQLGLTIGIADLRAWWQWVPCWLMSCFTGLEAIWVFLK